ncbi:MAG: hypothetical protein GEV06_19625 [Luteitalea sp.]|nr:hypothetical protein [Luteitalea sp.]
MRITAFLIGCVLLLSALAVQVVLERTRLQAAAAAPGEMPHARMAPMLRLLGVPFPAVAADICWIVAVQHFASLRHAPDPAADEALVELIDLTVTLDPAFISGYRTGAALLAEPPPMGPGDVQGALGVLRKGIGVSPERWELLFDEGFLQYRSLRRYDEAAASFLRASRLSGAPWWLRPLAANTLAEGGRRPAARALWRAQLDETRPEWMRRQAERRLDQLDALDEIDRLQGIVDEARRSGLQPPYSWDALRLAGRLQAPPRDPGGTPYIIEPTTGRVTLSPVSPLAPLPAEGGFVP